MSEVAAAPAAVGIEELKAVQIAANELSIFLINQLKDGIQLTDAVAVFEKIVSDADFKAKILAAAEGISKVPAEIKDLTLPEAAELITIQISYVPKLVEAFKK